MPSKLATPINLAKWIEQNRDQLKPPVGNKCVWEDDCFIVMVVGGPNARKDYHVNSTSEYFHQIKGDIAVGVIDPETGKREDIIIREGETFLLPPNVPHSPKRPAGTIGVVVEQKRPAGVKDKLQWYNEDTNDLLYEREFTLENIAVDLKKIMEEFWSNDDLRRNPKTGKVMAPPTEAKLP